MNDLIEALRKKALGNEITTLTKEYAENEKGKLVLVKQTQKTTKNDIDTQALLKLIEIEQSKEDKQLEEIKGLTDKQLQKKAYELAIQIIEEEQERRKK